MVIAVISDTHMPQGDRHLPESCLARMIASDAIIHCGDIAATGVLQQLQELGPPVHAVYGNVDQAALHAVLAHELVIEADGQRIGVIHDAGPADGRLERMRVQFPGTDAVVFGHSHIPVHETAADGFQIFNPGSPTERRRAPTHTMGIATASPEGLAFDLIHLD